MSNRNRDRSNKGAFRPNVNDLPSVPYEDVADATYGGRGKEVVNQWFGDIDPSNMTESGIQIADDGAIQAYEFRMTSTGIDPENRSINKEKWQQLGDLLFRFEQSIQWLIGDWLLYGDEHEWGKTDEIAEQFGYDKTTLYDYKSVAKRVPFELRSDRLTFGHHKLVAGKEYAEQEIWLTRAAEGDFDSESNTSKSWSISRMRMEMKGSTDDENETPFDRSVQRIAREVTPNKWKKLPSDERLKRYEHLKNILDKMEQWGFD